MNLIRKILFPIVPIYYGVTWLRNMLYDWNIKSSRSYNFPVICVGNLSVGGTGKTPMIEYLIKLLKDDYKVATLSRGYKRKTKGFVTADLSSTSETIGDEPFQFYNKFGNDVVVCVDEKRQHGIETLMSLNTPPEIVLLDDAFQHRKVKAGFNILLTSFASLYVNDFVLPTGNLREPRSGAKRANVIVITKCPDNISESDKKLIIKRLKPKENQSVFFSRIHYSERIIGLKLDVLLDKINNFTLVTGIANAEPLVKYLKSANKVFEHLNYKDHHHFSEADLSLFKSKNLIITTEKDYMRLKQFDELKSKLFYLPIQIEINKSKEFNSLIKSFIKRY